MMNKYNLLHTCSFFAALVLSSSAGCGQTQADVTRAPAEPDSTLVKEYKDTIQELIPGMAAEKIPDRQNPQQTLEKLCHEAAAPGREANRLALSTAIMSSVGSDTPKVARIWMLRRVEQLGGDEVVEGLSQLLADSDSDIRETARRGLANNPSPMAVKLLRTELSKGGDPEWQVALINALAWRRDAASVPAFAKLVASQEAAVARAALTALGTIGDKASLAALRDAAGGLPDTLKAIHQDAWLRAAEQLAAQMPADQVWDVYKDLASPTQPEHIRIAALTGMANATGPKGAGGILLQLIKKGDDKHLQLIAARLLQRMDRGATGMIVSALPDNPPETTALLLEVLGEHGDPEAGKAVIKYVDDSNAEVRVAAIEAIGRIGDEAAVEILIKRAIAATGDEREAARQSVAVLRGTKVDDTIVKGFDKADDPTRVELIQAVRGRRVAAAKPLLVGMAEHKEEAVRVAVLDAMERLANEKDLPLLIGMLSRSAGDAERGAAEQAIQSVCRRAGNAELATPIVIQALDKADARGQVALVHALGRLQTPDAFSAIRKASRSSEDAVKAAAQEALKQWKPVFITTWQYAGPFREEGKGAKEIFEVAFAPEKEGFKGFKPLAVKAGENGVIDLSKTSGAGSTCCGYLQTRIKSSRDQEIILSAGSDDGIRIWLNGKEVYAKNQERALNCGEDQVKLSLKEGENTLLVKITQAGGGWEFCMGAKADDGAPAEGLTFAAR